MNARRTHPSLLAAAGAIALPGLALAAEEAAHGAAATGGAHDAPANPMSFQLVPFISTIVVFGVVLFILSTKVWPKIVQGLRDRDAKIRSEIESAEAARRKAADALAQYEKSLGEARAEAAALLDKTRADQQKLAAELRAKADVELGAMRQKAMNDIEAARKDAVNEIYAQAVAIASEIAAKVLKREVNASDHKRLIDESLTELEAAGRR